MGDRREKGRASPDRMFFFSFFSGQMMPNQGVGWRARGGAKCRVSGSLAVLSDRQTKGDTQDKTGCVVVVHDAVGGPRLD